MNSKSKVNRTIDKVLVIRKVEQIISNCETQMQLTVAETVLELFEKKYPQEDVGGLRSILRYKRREMERRKAQEEGIFFQVPKRPFKDASFNHPKS